MEVQKKVIDKKLYNIELPDLRSDNKDHIYKKLSENLNGCVTLEEWNFLYNQTLLQKDHNYDILEIGSHTGVSTSALLLDAVEKKSKRKVVSVDNCSYEGVTRTKFKNNLDKFNLYSHVVEKNCNSLQYKHNNQFALIFIDGDHSYDGVRLDLHYFKDSVKKEGVICGHDYKDRQVRIAVEEFFITHAWHDDLFGEIINVPDNMWAYMRLR